MTVFLSPEDEYRLLKGYAPDHPVPISLESRTFPKNQARNLEMRRYAALDSSASDSVHRGKSWIEPGTLETARSVLDKAALASDIATVGLAAGGISAPIAGAAKGLGWAAEAGLGLVNGYDALANGNYGPLEAQAASLPARLLPGGRVLQKTLRTVRGPSGILRDASGQFRSSVLNNEAIEKAGQAAFERAAGTISGAVLDRGKP